MPALRIKLLPQRRQTVYNLRRWNELLADRELARIEGRIETDRYGHVVLSSVPPPLHGTYQACIGHLIHDLVPNARVITVCPISTADGVKAADVAWASPKCLRNLGNQECFPQAPEICVEVLSPCNTQAEIDEKMTPTLTQEHRRFGSAQGLAL
jgi:Uma2 family endonuclease